ncbi:MAG: prepilin peptidase [Candidatus Nanohaloarchaea archaeon]
MIGYIVFAVAFIGSSIAAYLDLKTTEVPDSVSVAVASLALVLHFVVSYTSGEWRFLISSILVGIAFFGLGWLLYLLGTWGGADAFVLGSIGFALPYLPEEFAPLFIAPWPFFMTLLFNTMIVGLVYSLLYAVYHGFRSDGVMAAFQEEMREYWRRAAMIVMVYISVIAALTVVYRGGLVLTQRTLLLIGGHGVLLLGLLMLYRYLQAVEERAMRAEVDVDELGEGDVLAEDVDLEDGKIDASRIVGLTEEEVEEIQEARETVTVKYGVRFVPSFPAALLISVTIGDLLYIVVSYVTV